MGVITKQELTKAAMTWRQAHFGAVMSGSLQLPHTSSNRTGVEQEVIHSSPMGWHHRGKGVLPGWCLEPSQHYTEGYYPPFQYCQYTWQYQCQGYCMWVHMLAEPTPGPQLPTSVVLVATYRELHLGSSWVPICSQDLSTHSVKIPTKAVVGQVVPANQVPPVVLLAETLVVHL